MFNRRSCHNLVPLLFVLASCAPASGPAPTPFALPPFSAPQTAWVQAVASGAFEARLMTRGGVCPVLHTDKGDAVMTKRAAATDKFPLLCAAPLAAGILSASIGAVMLPVPVAAPRRILVVGDTGCRLKGATLQDCNTPAQWPFPQVAAAAARLKPDLVIHVGDYLYRETPCPPGDAGCAGSPYGDNGPAWQADFFTPAAPLLAAAPIVLARGNHEDCAREGPGWLRLMGPFAFDPAAACKGHLPVFTVDLGGLRLAVMDDASAPETEIFKPDLAAYTSEIAGLAAIPGPVWFVHHRPIWAAVTGPLGLPIGGNQTLIQAAMDSAKSGAKSGALIAPNVELQLSGHIHSFESLNYDKGVPPQIVAGNGGDDLDVTPKMLKGTIFQGSAGVDVTDGLSVGGFGYLLMTRNAAGWTIDLYDPSGGPERQCRFISAAGAAKSRLDCPATK